MYIGGYAIAFDGKGEWSFGNDCARNVKFLEVDNSSSCYSDNRKNNFLILGEGPTFGINGSFGSPEKKFYINLSKASTNFCLSLHYNHNINYFFVNGKEIFELSFASEVFLMDLMLLSLEKYL